MTYLIPGWREEQFEMMMLSSNTVRSLPNGITHDTAIFCLHGNLEQGVCEGSEAISPANNEIFVQQLYADGSPTRVTSADGYDCLFDILL